MDPVTLVIVPGVLGGLVIAVLFFLLQRRNTDPHAVTVPFRKDPLSTDVINMSSIKVAGVGGLGLVAMAAAVALEIPRIFQTVAIGLVVGALGALIVILRRR